MGSRRSAPARGYESFQSMSVDAEGRIYVLAATERSRQMVDVYNGGELEFSFSAYRAPRLEVRAKRRCRFRSTATTSR